MQSVGLQGVDREHAAIEAHCLIEPPGLMMRERLLQTGDNHGRPFRVPWAAAT